MRRTITLVALAVVAITLPVGAALLVPYKTATLSISRRNCDSITDIAYFTISTRHTRERHTVNVDQLGPVTAPDILILHSVTTWRFPWSDVAAEPQVNDFAVNVKNLFGRMFVGFSAMRDAGQLSSQRYDELMQRRLALWNSDITPENVRRLYDQIMQENRVIFEPPEPPTKAP